MEPIGGHIEWMTLKNLRPATITQRRYALERLQKELGHDPLTATSLELATWYQRLAYGAPGRAPVGVDARATYLSHVRQFFKWAVVEGLLTADPSVRLVRPRLNRRIPRPIRDDLMRESIEHAPNPVRQFLTLAAYAGLRAGEIAGLHREHVLDGQSPPALLIADGKGGSQRAVPASPRVLESILPGAPPKGPLWRSATGGQLQAHRVSQIANKYLHESGIADTLHSFRHSFGTRAYAVSQDLRVTQELLGHQSPSTTAGYAGWSQQRAVDTVLSLDVDDA
jgi:integrase/recombinase XerC